MEENQKILFEAEITYTLQAIKENRKYSMYYRTTSKVVHTIFCVYLIYSLMSVFFPPMFLDYVPVIALFILLRRYSPMDKTSYNRMISGNEGTPVNHHYYFGEEYIHLENTFTGNHHKYQYSQIVGLAQTKNYFVLLLVHKQYVLLEKAKITGGTADDFVRFLCENCPDMKPKKLRSNMFGKITFYVLSVLILLLIGVLLYLMVSHVFF